MQLPTSELSTIVQTTRSRLHINFFEKLPTEVCLKILGYLDPDSLVRTALASKQWMGLAFERRLWEQLYIRDGFRILNAEVGRYEKHINAGKLQSYGTEDSNVSKRRQPTSRSFTSAARNEDVDMMEVDGPAQKSVSIFGGNTSFTKEPLLMEEDNMVWSPRSPPPTSSFVQPGESSASSYLSQKREKRSLSSALESREPSLISKSRSMIVTDPTTHQKRLNWQYLYAQRRRLEANWNAEKFVNFQLPHPDHPEEAHEECIYTLQYSGKYLVSGSRDRSLRIWNLETQRLAKLPLRQHTGSVLCLQFDADPEEDLIVSGSSDATVILWKFSTGQMIQRLRKAHRESVLNVRFDKRVLVTCSKDKMIKIFNRHPMSPGDFGYPGMSGAVGPVPTIIENHGYNPAPQAGLPVKPPFSIIGVLVGHNAAVNAVQIHGHEIVSASGDRNIKVWNWLEQKCTRTLGGHKKGIACVQYDGRRIVSGSSDNEVRIYDKETGLMVASLNAHTNLVRTVQAGFADLPNSAEEDAELARMTDMDYFRAVDAGLVSEDASLRGRAPNAGSRKPQDITAYGAKLPPGGGGGKFARIVSGSYDETIIIWRKDREDVWKAQHILRPEQAARAAVRRVRNDSSLRSVDSQNAQPGPTQGGLLAPTASTSTTTTAQANDRQAIRQALAQGTGPTQILLQTRPELLTQPELLQEIDRLNPVQRHVYRILLATLLQQNGIDGSGVLASTPSASQAAQYAVPPVATTTATTSNTQQPPTAAVTTTVSAAVVPTTVQSQPHVAQNAPQNPIPNPAANAAQPNMARVFKLQFDARRIICCSQTSTIVGWDFANGDADLEEASRFFAPIE